MKLAVGLVQTFAQTELKLKCKHNADERASYGWERTLEKEAESDKATQHHSRRSQWSASCLHRVWRWKGMKTCAQLRSLAMLTC